MKAIHVKFHGPTDRRGARWSCQVEGQPRHYYPFDHGARDPAADAAQRYAEKRLGWSGTLVCGYLPDGSRAFVLVNATTVAVADPSDLDPFTQAYMTCALWSTSDNSTPAGGEPLDRNYGIKDVGRKTLRRMVADCAKFQAAMEHVLAALPQTAAQAGHDFWLTRNGHGAGFWDGDWPEPAAALLTAYAKSFGEYDLIVGDDGQVHGDP